MSNGFEFYEGTATENSTEPRVTVRRGGQLVLTQAAVAKLGEGVTHVQLGFNPRTKAVGIRPAPEEGKGRYLLRAQKNSASRLVDGKRFFAHQGVKLEKVRRFDVEELGGGIIGFTLTGASEKEAASEPPPASAPDAASVDLSRLRKTGDRWRRRAKFLAWDFRQWAEAQPASAGANSSCPIKRSNPSATTE